MGPSLLAARYPSPLVTGGYGARSQGLSTWHSSHFTHPVPGRARNYTFLVSAMRADKLNALLSKGNTLKHEDIVFASLITAERSTTFGTIGLILHATPDNIAGTSPQDTRFPGIPPCLSPAQRKAFLATKYQLDTPADLLAKTLAGWNEVVLVGTAPGGSEVSASGIFVTSFASKPDIAAFEETAREWSLPVVQI